MLRIGILVAVLIAGIGSQVLADPQIGDPVEGQQLARNFCADCHHVEDGWTAFDSYYAPAFADIAANPQYTALAIRVFLRTPHVDMPDFILTEEQTDNVIGYILSLRPFSPQ